MREEKEQDDKLRQQYKDKWGRTPSESLTQQLREDQAKYQSLLQRATEADAKVKSQFEANVDSMRVLSLPKVTPVLSFYSLSKTFIQEYIVVSEKFQNSNTKCYLLRQRYRTLEPGAVSDRKVMDL